MLYICICRASSRERSRVAGQVRKIKKKGKSLAERVSLSLSRSILSRRRGKEPLCHFTEIQRVCRLYIYLYTHIHIIHRESSRSLSRAASSCQWPSSTFPPPDARYIGCGSREPSFYSSLFFCVCIYIYIPLLCRHSLWLFAVCFMYANRVAEETDRWINDDTHTHTYTSKFKTIE